MKITFNLVNTGLGDNGGSQTLIKSANTLVDLGCDVTIIDSGKNQYTWDKLKANHIIVKSLKNIPDSDIIIATGYNSVSSTILYPKRCGLKFHWIRGWELWRMSEQQIVNKILEAPTTKIVNSIGLNDKLQQYDKNPYIIRPGHNFEDFNPLNIRDNNKIVLGGLYNSGSKRSAKRTNWINDAYKYLKVKNPKTELYMFGIDGVPKYNNITKFIKNPDKKKKNRIYNKVNIWLAPSENEGLHIPPQEAMLTGCFIVGTNAPMSGMHDYLEDGVTGFVSDNNYKSFLKTIERASNELNNESIRENARNKILSLGSRNDNMEKMIKLFTSF